MEDIQKAYREKSKKHHPDLGGDEWAFRMVVRAYEILKTTSGLEKRPSFSTVANGPGFARQLGRGLKITIAISVRHSSKPGRIFH